jgi:hypothetical protein
MKRQKLLMAGWTLALLALFALPAAAVDNAIYRGADLWNTPGEGGSYMDFSFDPLPAGFFCAKAGAFDGRIVFKGVPLATGNSGELGNTDTIVERLDTAVFNKRGIASTRIQIRALNLVSVTPVKSACGDFNVTSTLDGEQPITRMRIIRLNAKGGRFVAPLHVNVRVVFTPVDGGEALEITRKLRFRPSGNASWAFGPGDFGVETAGSVLVDTDGDDVADTELPGTTNFHVGWKPGTDKALQQDAIFHESYPHGHLTTASTTASLSE